MTSTTDIAAELGLNPTTTSRWAAELGLTSGTGNHVRLTPSDVKIMRAWAHLTTHAHRHDARRAIREERDARWLAVAVDAVHTFDTVDLAARWWLARGARGVFWIIDLEPDGPVTAETRRGGGGLPSPPTTPAPEPAARRPATAAERWPRLPALWELARQADDEINETLR